MAPSTRAGCMVKLEKIDRSIVRPEDSPQVKSESIRGLIGPALGDEGEQQEEDCYHGDEDALRDPQSVETGSLAKQLNLTHITPFPMVEVMINGHLRWFGHVQRRDENNVTHRVMAWQYQVPDDEDTLRKHGTNKSRKT